MNALARLGLSEVLFDRRATLSIVLTVAIPVGALAFLASPLFQSEATWDGFNPLLLVLILVNPFSLVLATGIAVFLASVAGSAFTATTATRSERYAVLTHLGASSRQLYRIIFWECGLAGLCGIALGLVAGVGIGTWVNRDYAITSFWSVLGFAAVWIVPPTFVGILLAVRQPVRFINAPRTAPSSRPAGQPPIPKVALLLFLGSLTLTFLSALLYSGWLARNAGWSNFFWQLEGPSFIGLMVGTLGTLGSIFVIAPWLLQMLSRIVRVRGRQSLALRSLAAAPERSAGFIGGSIVLTALITMGAAGLLSDQEGPWADEPDDRRRIELSNCRAQCEDDVRANIDQFAIDAGIAAPQWVRISYTDGLHAHTGDGDRTGAFNTSGVTIFDTTPLTPELAEALDLSASEVAFVEDGGVLVDSQVISVVHAIDGDTPVEMQRVSLGGGVGVPGPVVISGADTRPSRTATLLIFDQPVPRSVARQIENVTNELDVYPSTLGDGPQLNAMTLAIAGAAVLFSLALAAANIAARELESDIATQTALGAAPSFRSRLLATQTAIQQLIGIMLGAPIGAALFFLVTRGDPTVPDAIIPLEEIGVLAIAALAATLSVFSMHRPATPAVSSRVSIVSS